MSLRANLTICTLLVREVIRATLVPWHLLLYLPQRGRWRREALDMLSQPPAPSDEAMAREFGARAKGTGSIFISAGETSGESHAAKVIRAVARHGGQAQWTAFGGHLLSSEGAEVLYPLSDRAVMGFSGVLESLPFVVKAVARFLRLLDENPPDLVVLVDYPGLHLVLARLARKRGIPVLHYIAPQYWAWAPWRMHRYKRSFSATLTILPFESTFFGRAGIPSEYVGHPLLDQLLEQPEIETSPDSTETSRLFCLLPGSRRKEILANLPGMIRVARQLKTQLRTQLREQPTDTSTEIDVVLPHVDPRRVPLIRELLRTHGGDFVNFHEGPIGPILARARLVLAKSGTGSLESCLHGTPTIVAYKLGSRFAKFFSTNFLSVPWIASANLIAGRQVIPEFCFREDETWNEIADTACSLFGETDARRDCLAGIEEVRKRLGKPGASDRVAKWILPYCSTRLSAMASPRNE